MIDYDKIMVWKWSKAFPNSWGMFVDIVFYRRLTLKGTLGLFGGSLE